MVLKVQAQSDNRGRVPPEGVESPTVVLEGAEVVVVVVAANLIVDPVMMNPGDHANLPSGYPQ